MRLRECHPKNNDNIFNHSGTCIRDWQITTNNLQNNTLIEDGETNSIYIQESFIFYYHDGHLGSMRLHLSSFLFLDHILGR